MVGALAGAVAANQASPGGDDRAFANLPVATPARGYAPGPWGLVHYYDNGVRGRAVLLLHQAPMSARQFDAVYAPLARRGLRAIGVDTPGFGMSDPTPFVPTIGDWTRAVIAVADHLKLKRFDLVGHHTGALLGTETAIRHPQRVRAVVINGAFPITEAERQSRLERLQRAEIDFVYEPDGSHLVETFKTRYRIYGAGADPRLITRVTLEKFQGFGPFWHGHNAAYRYDHAEALARLETPALLLTNTGDQIYDLAQRARRLRPDLDYVELQGGSVDITDQQPEAWCDAVAAFLAKVSA